MSTDLLEVSIARRVAVVWMLREKVRNAFNENMIAELAGAFARLGADSGVRAIVLAGRGPAFCAGADLDWMRRVSGYTEDENRKDARALAEMLRTIYLCPKPTIARVHGDAYAGGIGLVAACDMAFAATTASFCLSETRLGLIPATISPYVIKAMGPNAARRYFLTAERFDAAEAFRIGLVHAVAPPENLDAFVNETIGALMLTSGSAVA
jgi:methylglutaconyl-CoA hydratase